MNELALFAGAGGGILGGHLLGWRTVAAVEIEDYPRRVLLQRQADGILPRFPIWDDVRTFDGRPWRGKVDVISGGFPCQDISTAGKGAGLDGARSGLWFEMARIIGEVRPSYVLVENSPALVIRGLDRVLADLTALGYDTRWGIVSAANVGALHKRERIWIVANAHGSRLKELDLTTEPKRPGLDTGETDTRSSDLANADNSERGWKLWREWSRETGKEKRNSCSVFDQPEPIRMADGVAYRVDRLKAAGNGQVPAVVRRAWDLLK